MTDDAGRIVHLNRAAQGPFVPEERPAAQILRDERIVGAVEQEIQQRRESADDGERERATLELPGGPRTGEPPERSDR